MYRGAERLRKARNLTPFSLPAATGRFQQGLCPALLLLTPLFGLRAVVVRWGAPGPVFYRAVRVGRDGVPFRLYKFRSMTVDAAHSGPAITAHATAASPAPVAGCVAPRSTNCPNSSTCCAAR